MALLCQVVVDLIHLCQKKTGSSVVQYDNTTFVD